MVIENSHTPSLDKHIIKCDEKKDFFENSHNRPPDSALLVAAFVKALSIIFLWILIVALVIAQIYLKGLSAASVGGSTHPSH